MKSCRLNLKDINNKMKNTNEHLNVRGNSSYFYLNVQLNYGCRFEFGGVDRGPVLLLHNSQYACFNYFCECFCWWARGSQGHVYPISDLEYV